MNFQELIEKGGYHRIFFVNGYQETFKILDADDEKIMVQDKQGHNKAIYIHAISTINLD